MATWCRAMFWRNFYSRWIQNSFTEHFLSIINTGQGQARRNKNLYIIIRECELAISFFPRYSRGQFWPRRNGASYKNNSRTGKRRQINWGPVNGHQRRPKRTPARIRTQNLRWSRNLTNTGSSRFKLIWSLLSLQLRVLCCQRGGRGHTLVRHTPS